MAHFPPGPLGVRSHVSVKASTSHTEKCPLHIHPSPGSYPATRVSHPVVEPGWHDLIGATGRPGGHPASVMRGEVPVVIVRVGARPLAGGPAGQRAREGQALAAGFGPRMRPRREGRAWGGR